MQSTWSMQDGHACTAILLIQDASKLEIHPMSVKRRVFGSHVQSVALEHHASCSAVQRKGVCRRAILGYNHR